MTETAEASHPIVDAQDPRSAFFVDLERHLRNVVGPDALDGARTVLEFGCGKRGLLDLYRRPGQKAIGVDIHDYRKLWREKDIQYLQSDGRTIPLPDKTVDLVISHSVVEHVDDVPQAIFEIDRVTRPSGLIYITVAPLYYSPTGSHDRRLPKWDHLNPGSPNFLMESPLGENSRAGASLNGLTCAQFLAAVGNVPWDILSFTRRVLPNSLPGFLKGSEHPLIDLLTKEFRLVARKVCHLPRSSS